MAGEMDIQYEEVKLPPSFKGKLAFVLHNVMSQEECESFIDATEDRGYELALVNVGLGRQTVDTDVRNSSRHIWDSVEMADKIWKRVEKYVPKIFNERKVIGLNERLRFLRYKPGEYFKPHMDGRYMRENGERSYITLQLYLNQGFKGGSTTFMDYNEDKRVEVVPKTGSVLIFQHDILHEGSILKKGKKYAMRTDVMYAAQKADQEEEK